jgi:VIT1/CCC1 family predicted Fe2+/Mn2+ transporter
LPACWIRRILAGQDAGREMSVQSQPVTKGTSAKLSDAAHVLAALAAGLVPLLVFVVLSYHQTMQRAQSDLT